MANLILNGSTSGSVTLSSPAVSGTTTLTLPTTSGTVVTTGTTGQVIASGALPIGSVLQVVNAITSTNVSNSTATMTDTGLTATITPKFSTSKILVLVSQNGVYKSAANANNMVDLILAKNGTGVLGANFSGATATTSTALENSVTASLCYLDSPATTSATTYKTMFNSRNGTASVSVQYAGVSTSFITLMEIAG